MCAYTKGTRGRTQCNPYQQATMAASCVQDGQEVARWNDHAGVPTCLKVTLEGWHYYAVLRQPPSPMQLSYPAARGCCCAGSKQAAGVSRRKHGLHSSPITPGCPHPCALIRTCLQFSPRKMLWASACSALAFWIPDMARLQQLQQANPQPPAMMQQAPPMQQQQAPLPPQQGWQQPGPPPQQRWAPQPPQQQQQQPPMYRAQPPPPPGGWR